MEEFLRDQLGEKYATFYRESTKDEQAKMDLNIIALLAGAKSDQPVKFEKETIIKNGKLTMRYILEAELDYKKSFRE